MVKQTVKIGNIVAGPLGVNSGKNELDSIRFVSLYLSLIPYYLAATLERKKTEKGWEVWVDWLPGGKTILVAVSPG